MTEAKDTILTDDKEKAANAAMIREIIDASTPASPPDIKTIVLNKFLLGMNMYVDPALTRDMCLTVDEVVDGIIVRMVRHLTAAKLGESVVIFPTTWWDAFKERWFPKWAKKKWPIKYTEFESLLVYDDFMKQHPEHMDKQYVKYYTYLKR